MGKKLMRFRVLQGRHYQDGKCYGVTRSVDPKTKDIVVTALPDGDIVSTTIDLAERFNAPGLESPKFLKLEGGGDWLTKQPESSDPTAEHCDVEQPTDEFDEMSLQELREFAKAEEIDISSLRSKKAVIVCLRETISSRRAMIT